MTQVITHESSPPNTFVAELGKVDKSILPSGTNRSGQITTGGTAQTVAPTNSQRKSLTIQNISDVDMWVNEIGANAQADTAGSWKVPAGFVFSTSTSRAISIVAATAGKKFTATEV